jgi:hypothetical protein
MQKKPVEAFDDSYIVNNGLVGIFRSIYSEAVFSSYQDRYDLFFQFFMDEQFDPGAAQQLARGIAEQMGDRDLQAIKN